MNLEIMGAALILGVPGNAAERIRSPSVAGSVGFGNAQRMTLPLPKS